MFKYILITFIFSFNAMALSIDGLFSQKEKKKLGIAYYHYEESSQAMALTKVLHDKYDLLVSKVANFHTSYINERNFEQELKKASRLTVFSKLTFREYREGYRLEYSPIRGAGTVFFDLGTNFNDEIEVLFEKVQKFPQFVSLDGESNFGRGGTHLRARSIPRPQTVTLLCKNEIYSDGSGGDRCSIHSSKIDFYNKSIDVYVDGSRGDTLVPKKYLNDWDENYWNNKF